mgnify:CR=1 FL=1
MTTAAPLLDNETERAAVGSPLDRHVGRLPVAAHRFDNAKRRRPDHHARQAMLTPPYALEPVRELLGGIGLDPCTEPDNPTRADKWYSLPADGCALPWDAPTVWCNPPYGPFAAKWLERCADHGNAVAFVFARTETAMFQDHVWPKADAMLFLRGRVQFRLPGGGRSGPAGAPSVLIAYGQANADALALCGISGAFVRLRASDLEAA